MKHLRHYLRRRCRGPRLLVLATVIMMGYLVSFQPLLQGWLKPALGTTPCREPITQRHLLSEGEETTTADEEMEHDNGTKLAEKKDPLFPKDLFSLEQRRQGAVSLHVLGMIYMFVALAIVCDEFFVPSLDVIIERLEIQDDVAGATFMAAGGSAPELFTSVIGVFVSFDDVGIGTIVGSAVFNILFVIGMCSLFSKTILQLTWWPLFRDVTFYSASLIILIIFFLDNSIYWYEALLLLSVYATYVFFMRWNVQVEQWVKKHLNKNKVARVSSADQLVSGEAGRRANTPVTHAGSKFRHGLLQLMISSIDPMHDGSSSSGVVDAKATQNHAIASLKVLLDATKTSSTAGTPTGSELNKPQEGLGPNASVQESGDSGQYSQETEMSQLNSRNNSNDNDDLKEETSTTNCRPDRSSRRLSGEPVILRRPSMEAAMQHNHLNHLSPMDAIAPPLATDTGTANPDGKEDEEENEPLDLSWPDGARKRITYVILLPLVLPLWITLPDTRRPEKKKYFVVTFLGSIVWIAIFSYLMVWWASQVGETIGIPNEVMGLTFLAAGTSIPDLITSVIVARKGLGDMAVSSSIGSNIFDVTVGLPFPWFLYGVVKLGEPVLVSSKGMACSIVILFLMLLFVIMTIACFKWRMNRGLGIIMFLLYFVFVAVSLLFEYKVWVCPL